MAGLERELDGVGEARPVARQDEAVHDDVDVVRLLLVELGQLVRRIRRPVDPDAREAVALERGERLLVATLLPLRDGRVEDRLAAGSAEERVDDLFGGLLRDGLATVRTVGRRGRAVENAEIVVDLGHRRNDRARIAARRVLLDRDRGRESLDALDVRLREAVEELARVGAQRLDVAALSLGVERVERERGLAAAGKAGDDGQGVAGNGDVDPAQVMDAGVGNDNIVHGFPSSASRNRNRLPVQ